MTRLAVIIVSWNTRDLLRRCLDALQAALDRSGVVATVIVVDNASTDGTPAMLRAEYPAVQLIESRHNLGFAGGNNLALRRLLDHHATQLAVVKEQKAIDNSPEIGHNLPGINYSLPDYILLLNPDTEVAGDAVSRLVQYLERHPGVAVVGPRLVYPDGAPQPSRRHFPTLGTFFWESTPLETSWPNNPWARRYRCADAPDDVEQEVDWLVGAALLVRTTVIEHAGLLDPGFTMYSEELEWQRRIRQRGVGSEEQGARRTVRGGPAPDSRRLPSTAGFPSPAIVYLPDALVIHHEGKSSEQALTQRYLNFQCSRLRYARMLYGDRFAALLRMFLCAAYSAELAIEAAKWLLGHKRPLRARRVAVYWRVVRGLGSTGGDDAR